MNISKQEARKIVMDASQTAMQLFRQDNPLPENPSDEYFVRQINFINGYIATHVSAEIQMAAV